MKLQEESAVEHPIILAAWYCHFDIVKVLLNRDKSLATKKSNCGLNLLHLITDEELFKELVLLAPALLREKSHYSNYPIYRFLSHSDQFVKWVIEQDREQLYLENNDGNLLIHGCLDLPASSSSTLAEWMLSEDFSLARAKNKFGDTPLHLALKWSHLSVAELLIKRDPKLVFERNEAGELPIARASYEESSTDFFLWLFEEVPDLVLDKRFDSSYPVHCAASEGNLTLFKYLLEKTPQELLES